MEKDSEPKNDEKKKPYWCKKHIVHIKGLPFCSTISEIKNFLFDCGEIKSINQILEPLTNRWSGSVTVRFSDQKGVENAISLSKSVWTGSGGDGTRFVTIAEHNQKGKSQQTKLKNNNQVFLGNLHKNISEIDIRRLLGIAGEIKKVKLPKGAGFAYVSFENCKGRENALLLNNKLEFEAEKIKIRSITDNKNKKSKKLKEKNPKKKIDKGKNKKNSHSASKVES